MIYKIIYYLTFASEILPFLVAIFHFKKLNKNLKIFGFYLGLSCLSDILSLIFNQFKISSAIIFNVYSIFELIFVLFFLFQLVNMSLKNKRNLIIFSLIFFVQIFFSLSENYVKTLNTYSWLFSNFVFVFFSFYALYKMIANDAILVYTREPNFWILIGIIVFFAGTTFVYLTYSTIFANNPTEGYMMWKINNFLAILANSFFTIGLWQVSKIKS